MRKISCWLPGLAVAASLVSSVMAAAYVPDSSAPDCGIQAAIDDAASKGGGTVDLPAGTYPLRRYLFLRGGVTLRGAGEGKTILTVANPPQQRPLTALDRSNGVAQAKGDLSGLHSNMTVCIFSGGVGSWTGALGFPTVGSVNDRQVRFSETDRNTYIRASNSAPYMLFGNYTRLAAEAVQGGRSIRVKDPGIGSPGSALTFSGKGDLWEFSCNVITGVTGDTFYLERPLNVSAPTGTLVRLAHALITSEFQTRIGVENLTLRGFRAPTLRADWGGFTLAAFHSRDCTNVTLRNVTVEDWNGDGISVQGGANALVDHCTSLRCGGHGFHPGTGLTVGTLTNLVSGGNAGDGVYYCWHNDRVDVVDCVLTNNGNHGVGGLGIPGDIHCTVARNRIENNGAAGILVLGGPNSGNTIASNLIRDNSRNKSGAWPGIALHAIYQESSSGCLVISNTIESTSEPSTQWIGIEERHARASTNFAKNADPATGFMLSDRNTIDANTLRGHKTADIVVAGSHTTVGAGQGVVKPAAAITSDVPR